MNKQRMAGSLLVNTAKLATFGVFMWLSVQMTRGRLTSKMMMNLN